jgi:hypothetical protein
MDEQWSDELKRLNPLPQDDKSSNDKDQQSPPSDAV